MALTDLRSELEAAFPQPELRKWAHVGLLLEVTSKFNGRPWLFRGESSDQYKLIPKIGRPRKDKSAGRIPYLFSDERAALNLFQSRARALVSASSPRNDLEWMALAQHHGAPTRLLDWTEGLLTALWFAGEPCVDVEKVEGTDHVKPILRDGCLWCAWDVPLISKKDADNPFDAERVGAFRPGHFDRRISAQQSVLTLQPKPTEPLHFATLFKFRVVHGFKFAMRKRLDAAGVNGRVLFPDLAGLGDDVAWRYKNNWLHAYRDDGSAPPEPEAEDDPTASAA